MMAAEGRDRVLRVETWLAPAVLCALKEARVHDPVRTSSPLSERSDMTDAVRLQILATEHSSLLATRGATWNEMFARSSMYLTVLSAATVALALVAQATGFGDNFRVFALLVLPVVLVLGLGTQLRLVYAQGEDAWLVIGMNRLRHAYLEIAPELEPYFVTGHHDDSSGLLRTYGPETQINPVRMLAGTPILVGVINAVVAGVLAALVVEAAGGATELYAGVGVVAGLAYMTALATVPFRQIARMRRDWRPLFPTPEADMQ